MYVCGRDLAWGRDKLLYEQLSRDNNRSSDYFDDHHYGGAYNLYDNHYDNSGTFGTMLFRDGAVGRVCSNYRGSMQRCSWKLG